MNELTKEEHAVIDSARKLKKTLTILSEKLNHTSKSIDKYLKTK